MKTAAPLQKELAAFVAEQSFRGKGPISVALVVTQHARHMGLPLDDKKLITEGGGQVLGLGKGAVQAVLKRHGVDRVLAREGGRTSRGSLQNMRQYVAFLNRLSGQGDVDLDVVEAFWIERVHEFFAGKPFKIQTRCVEEPPRRRPGRYRASRGAAESDARNELWWGSPAASRGR